VVYVCGMTSTLLVVAVLTLAPPVASATPTSSWQEAARCPELEGKAVPAPQGLTLCSNTARVAIRAAEEPQDGVRIVAVEAGSPAESAGFQPGDVVYRVGGEWVSTGAAAIKRLEALRPGQEAVVNFWRDGLPFLIRVRGR
jgi:putative serine protease PepD